MGGGSAGGRREGGLVKPGGAQGIEVDLAHAGAVGAADAQAGAVALNDYARTNDPFAAVGKTQIAVDVTSVIRASPSSFRIAWVERRYLDGSLASSEHWSAILTITVQSPRDADALRKNPLGIYVNAINWSKELGS